MMEAGMYLARELFIGLIFGVPAGVIGVLTIKRTLEHGFWAGTVTGFGSAAADLIYGCIGVCGLTVVSDRLISLEQPIRICGGAAIGLYGLMTLRRAIQGRNIQADAYATEEEPERAVCPDPQVQTTPGRYSLLFLSAFLIAVTNPATILAFVTAFASFGILGGVTLGQGVLPFAGTGRRNRKLVDFPGMAYLPFSGKDKRECGGRFTWNTGRIDGPFWDWCHSRGIL